MSAFFYLCPKSHEPMRTLSQNWVVAALAATWLAAQNVGIGTTTPLTRLHVAAGDIFLGEAAGANGFVLHSRSSNSYDYLRISTRTGGSYEWSKGITLVRSTGNVGIGTTTPGAKLQVAGSVAATGWNEPNTLGAVIAGDGTNGLLYARNGAGSWAPMYIDATNVYINAQSGGKVGIGTTAPNAKLTIANNVATGFLDTYGEYQIILYDGGTAASSYGLGIRAGTMVFNTNGGYSFDRTGSATSMVIDNNGNVGIGTTAPHSAAILQLQATNKGFLPTQVALTSATSWSPLVGASVDGMLVYNTATAGTGQNAVSPGYYYWRAGRWRRFSENAYAGMIQGVLSSAAQNLTTNHPSWQYLNSYIDLPPGKWIVYSVQILNPSSMSTSGSIWVRTRFSDNPTTCATTADYIGSSLISGLLPNSAVFSLVIGQVIINNTSGTTKRYYYCGHKDPYGGYNANLVNFSTTIWNENQLYALPAE
jgi:hypothetical protein